MLIDAVGILAGCLFAYSGIPQAIAVHRAGRVENLSAQLQWCVFGGAVLMLAYITIKLGFDWIVWAEYSITIISWAVILYYNYHPRMDWGVWWNGGAHPDYSPLCDEDDEVPPESMRKLRGIAQIQSVFRNVDHEEIN